MEYKNLDLEAFDYQEVNGTRSFKVRVQSTPEYGEHGFKDAVSVSLPGNLDSRLRSLELRNLALKEVIELGRDLGSTLFPKAVRDLFEKNLAIVQDKGDRLRIRLKLDDFPLADIPWEYVYLPQPDLPEERWGPLGFLALDARVSLVRYEMMEELLGSLTPMGPEPLRIAVLLADPKPEPGDPHPRYPPLKLDNEQKKIQEALVKVKQVRYSFYPDATSDELLYACDSHILHFAGHGEFKTEMGAVFRTMEGKGALVLLDEDKKPSLYEVDKLQVILSGTPVRLAVLGACETGRRDHINAWTGIAPALARVGIPAVVGMQYTIRDKNATHFSWGFYYALAENKTIDEAMTLGRKAVFNACQLGERSWRDWGVPVLYLRTDAAEDGKLFPDLPAVSPGQPATPPAGEVTVGPIGMLAGTPALGGAAISLPPVLCPKPGCGEHVSTKYCPQCRTQVRCLRCSTLLPAFANFCGECGLPVAG